MVVSLRQKPKTYETLHIYRQACIRLLQHRDSNGVNLKHTPSCPDTSSSPQSNSPLKQQVWAILFRTARIANSKKVAVSLATPLGCFFLAVRFGTNVSLIVPHSVTSEVPDPHRGRKAGSILASRNPVAE